MGVAESTQYRKLEGVLVIHKYYEDCVKLKFYTVSDAYFKFFYLMKCHSKYHEYLALINLKSLISVKYYEEAFLTGMKKGSRCKVKKCISRLKIIKLPESVAVNITHINDNDKHWNMLTTDKGEKYFSKKCIVNKKGYYTVKFEMSNFQDKNQIWKNITQAKIINPTTSPDTTITPSHRQINNRSKKIKSDHDKTDDHLIELQDNTSDTTSEIAI
jgi:hypothetical protein